ncbi:hypothetical protein [Candidatus Solirubrobacter pratensis]|uniref:hypothetical protein n=1 Tax=Candidatus Solirubrobacter pratensis TaxID=1298857 RepID=UPI00048911DB|nr:hypothetical protein [Candidatus Solirubrobacter pratensis]
MTATGVAEELAREPARDLPAERVSHEVAWEVPTGELGEQRGPDGSLRGRLRCAGATTRARGDRGR